MQAGHHSAMAGAGLPYDYRVAYFERAGQAMTYGFFLLPWLEDLNTAIPSANNSAVNNALLNADFNYSVSCGWSPVVTSFSGDIQMFGDAGWFFLGVYQNKWRPGGVGRWTTTPTTSQIPLVSGNVVRIQFVPHGYDMDDSDGHSFSLDYDHSAIAIGNGNGGPHPPLDCLLNPSRDTNCYRAGFRFFHCYVYNSDPTYGFEANYICVIKDGEPYIYDTVNDRFFPKQNGDVVVGPQVPPNWDHMTWTEPS